MISTGIDTDPIGEYFRFRTYAVAVNDDATVVDRTVEKLIPYPQLVFLGLFLKRNTGPDSGVNEIIVPALPGVLAGPGQEFAMCFG